MRWGLGFQSICIKGNQTKNIRNGVDEAVCLYVSASTDEKYPDCRRHNHIKRLTYISALPTSFIPTLSKGYLVGTAYQSTPKDMSSLWEGRIQDILFAVLLKYCKDQSSSSTTFEREVQDWVINMQNWRNKDVKF